MIEEIVLNCGPTEASAPLRLAGTPGVTILVGPNNCGKSALLEAIYHQLAGQGDGARASALAGLGFPEMTGEIVEEHPLFHGRLAADPITIPSYTTAPKSDGFRQICSNPHGPWAKAFRGSLLFG
ncbi:AAA family ATPase [Pseudorhodobacter ferrugineus]|uniref:AAA family ATPase n=1 Tax=Pseudorhodobacter ferrugineus TaxID=77008 RepID=UPI000A43FFE9|nr:AAA family ATPase [Pseudorhodobacter ferrugineus]